MTLTSRASDLVHARAALAAGARGAGDGVVVLHDGEPAPRRLEGGPQPRSCGGIEPTRRACEERLGGEQRT
jgi:hypothetical protein